MNNPPATPKGRSSASGVKMQSVDLLGTNQYSPTTNGMMSGYGNVQAGTAPIIGQQRNKATLLAGFDPLLNEQAPASCSTPVKESKGSRKPSSLTPTPPHSPSELDMSSMAAPADEQSFRLNELRKLAQEMGGPQKQSMTTQSEHSKGFLKGKKLLSPKRQSKRNLLRKEKTEAPQSLMVATASPPPTPKTQASRKLPWKRTRRQSLPTKLDTSPSDLLGDHILDASDSTHDPIAKHDPYAKHDPFAQHDQLPNNQMQIPYLAGLQGNTNANASARKLPASVPSSPMIQNSVPSSPMIQDLYQVVLSQQEAGQNNLTIPALAKPSPTSFLTGKEVIRSSENDPSPFQLEIPELKQFLVCCKLCQFQDEYRKEDQKFDLNESLVGVPRLQLQSFVTNGIIPSASGHLVDEHKPIVQNLLDCADDVELAIFFQETKAGTTADERREVVVFERQSQFIVVFRGTTSQQQGKAFKSKKPHPLVALNPEEPSSEVYDLLKDSYLDFESRVFQCLDHFTEENPFCDVVFTGHSFGGAMATLAAYRYAINRSVVRVSCYVFGSPKVGNRAFRQSANSLPNLKVMRVENENDSKCYAPAEGFHVGHSIAIQLSSAEKETVLAYKFDDDHDARQLNHQTNKPKFGSSKKERDVRAYVSALEEISNRRLPWLEGYVGDDVDDGGAARKKREERQMV